MGKWTPSLLLTLIITVSSITAYRNSQIRHVRSIDLAAAHSLHTESKLPGEVRPESYTLKFKPVLDEFSFTGDVKIVAKFEEPTNKIVLHAVFELDINENDIKLYRLGYKAYFLVI